MNRHGDWMQTYTGRQFWPLDPRTDEIDIRDIAHSLSLQCRYAGHVDEFYSVAEHSCHVSDVVARTHPEYALAALLHDGSEAYLVDVPKPIKRFLTGYDVMERNLMTAIFLKYNIFEPLPDIVKEIDERILNDERNQLMAPPPVEWAGNPEMVKVAIQCWSPYKARREFLSRFHDLTKGKWA